MALLVLGATLAFAPIVQQEVAKVDSFAFTFQSTPQGPAHHSFLVHTFCAPSGASDNGTVSFTWTDVTGGRSNFTVDVSGVNPPPNPDVLIYNVTEQAGGGFSFASGSPFPCEYPINFIANAPIPQTVSVSGAFVYNTTGTRPLL